MAVKIYKSTDRIPVQIGELVFKLAPLSYIQKMEIYSLQTKVGGASIEDAAKAAFLAIKYSLKEVIGLESAVDGSVYELEFEDDSKKALKDDCVSDIFSLEEKNTLITCMFKFIESIPKEIVDSEGKPLAGVKILPVESLVKKK